MIINQSALAGIYKSFNTIFNQAFEGAASMWDLIAMLAPSSGRSVDYKWLGDFPMMREWVGTMPSGTSFSFFSAIIAVRAAG